MSTYRGNIIHTSFNVDLTTATVEELQRLPQIATRERAMAIVNARPSTRWEQVAHVEGFNKEMADELRSGGARLGRRAA